MTLDELVKYLQQAALNNYDAGGHWIWETWGASDYETFIKEQGPGLDPKTYARRLGARWTLYNEQERNAGWGGPDESPY